MKRQINLSQLHWMCCADKSMEFPPGCMKVLKYVKVQLMLLTVTYLKYCATVLNILVIQHTVPWKYKNKFCLHPHYADAWMSTREGFIVCIHNVKWRLNWNFTFCHEIIKSCKSQEIIFQFICNSYTREIKFYYWSKSKQLNPLWHLPLVMY